MAEDKKNTPWVYPERPLSLQAFDNFGVGGLGSVRVFNTPEPYPEERGGRPSTKHSPATAQRKALLQRPDFDPDKLEGIQTEREAVLPPVKIDVSKPLPGEMVEGDEQDAWRFQNAMDDAEEMFAKMRGREAGGEYSDHERKLLAALAEYNLQQASMPQQPVAPSGPPEAAPKPPPPPPPPAAPVAPSGPPSAAPAYLRDPIAGKPWMQNPSWNKPSGWIGDMKGPPTPAWRQPQPAAPAQPPADQVMVQALAERVPPPPPGTAVGGPPPQPKLPDEEW